MPSSHPSAAPPPSAPSTGKAARTPTDIAKLLVQTIARQFYGIKGAVLVDQLVRKECFRDEDIAKRLGMQPKDIAKIAHRLVEDGIVHLHRRSEARDNPMQKAQQRTYYYFDYSKATDAIKWRMWRVQQTIDVKLRNELDAQGYVCPLCKASYTPLDASSLFDPSRNLLACSICQTEVINNENEEDIKGNKDRMQRLNRQTKGIVDLLKGLEGGDVPRFDVETYLALHGPALGLTAQLAAAASGTSSSANAAKVTVTLAGDDDEANELKRQEEERRRKREQNALPSWIERSTIASDSEVRQSGGAGRDDPAQGEGEYGHGQRREATPEAFSATAVPGMGSTLRMGDFDGAGESKPSPGSGGAEDGEEAGEGGGGGGGADLDAYYASLASAASQPPTTADAEVEDFGSFSLPVSEVGTAASKEGTPLMSHGEEGTAGKRMRELSSSGEFEEGGGAKRLRLSPSASLPPLSAPVDAFSPALEAGAATSAAAALAEEEEYDDDEFEEAGDEGEVDPNQLIGVAGKMMPFSEVTEDLTGEMSAEEYSAYWEVYQRVNG
ncbi:hypothetical protein JCM11641_001123 [Rhodosporidiobolus odoratus]